jgi:phosphatidylethanolamine-binding protein (PEBP) family uncharacterized protein
MRPRPVTTSCATLIAALAMAGCGSSSSAPSLATIQFKSAAIATGHPLPTRYTCDGIDVPPTLEWGAVPSGTGELVLLVVGLAPGSANRYSASVEWAVAGINPRVHTLVAGHLPPGAHVGLANDGQRRYSICPKKGVSEPYQFMLYAVPASLKIAPNFAGISVLATLSRPLTQTSAIGQGAFVAVYQRS